MNTRRKLLQPKPPVPSTRWHLMHEPYHALFETEWHQHVETWYNTCATGVQRDLFRDICAELFAQDPTRPDPSYPSAYTATVQTTEARCIVKNFGRTLSELGRRKAHVWLLHVATSRHRRDQFRDVFAGCQTIFRDESVMHTDFVSPDATSYAIDRTHFQHSVDWNNLPVGASPQSRSTTKNPNVVRVTKPKSQFDGVDYVAGMGKAGMSQEEIIRELREKQAAYLVAEHYYVDADGSTVYKAAGGRTRDGTSKSTRNILATVTAEPMVEWKVKTCD